jgi:tetratricopeptide (TPR) repeat protein
MNHGVRPEPDPRRLSLEALEQKLRALPPAAVPKGLPSKLIAGIPAGKAAGSVGSQLVRHWPWIGVVGLACISLSAIVYSWVVNGQSTDPAAANESSKAAATSKVQTNVPATSKAIRDFEQAVRIDPFNANAWFGLAKAQAGARQTADAISAAQKAIDVARARNRLDLAGTVETWLRSYRAAQSKRPPP